MGITTVDRPKCKQVFVNCESRPSEKANHDPGAAVGSPNQREGDFSRWTPWYTGASWAYRRFKEHHTEFNDLYWAHEAASRKVFRETKSTSGRAADVLGFRGGDEGRLPIDASDWKRYYIDFGNWSRLSALLAINGYFELYLKTVASLALESDPGVVAGASHRVDGCLLLKYGRVHSRLQETGQVVTGEWPARLSAYKKLFGHIPPGLKASVGELERLRRLRNDAGHSFGRSMEEEDYRCRISPEPMTRLSLQRLKRILSLVANVAKVIDQHLAPKHIGAYEMAYFYHNNRGRLFPKDNEPLALRKAFGRALGVGPGSKYCLQLVEYYEGL